MVVLVIKPKASNLKLAVKGYMVIILIKLKVNEPVSYSLVIINDFITIIFNG